MKKVLFTALALTFAITTFTGCKDKGTNTPTTVTVSATNIAGETGDLTEVRAIYATEFDFTSPSFLLTGTTVAAIAPFTNNGFTIGLLPTVEDGNLKELTQANLLGGITLSATFKGTFVYFQPYKGTVADGSLYFRTAQGAVPLVGAYLLYADSAVTIKGETTPQVGVAYDADMDIKVGWQWIYIKSEVIPETTVDPIVPEHTKYTIHTTPFSGVTLGWIYIAS